VSARNNERRAAGSHVRAEPGAAGTSNERTTRGGFALYLALVAALVVAVAAVISRYFWLYEKSVVWKTDGLAQHYPALQVFGAWVRGIAASPGSAVPLWSWSMGLGADIIGTLAWPVLGDPFPLLSLGVSPPQLEYAYAALLGLRVVAAGLASAVFFRKMGARPVPAATGVVLYLFATFLMIQGRHPFFISAMVFLPLLLWGVELALRDERRWPLALFAGLAAASNFYFFYMLTIITVFYAVARFLELTAADKRWKQLGPTALRVGGYYVLGAALAAPILLPAIAAALGTARSGAEFEVPLLYPGWVYRSQIAAMTTGHFGAKNTFLGFGYLAWLMVPVLFLRRGRHTATKFMVALCIAFIVVPWFGSMLNGFTFPSNRHSFALGLFLGLGVALLLSEDEPVSRRDLLAMSLAYAAYAGPILLLVRPVPAQLAAPMLVGAATLGVFGLEAFMAHGRGRPESHGAQSPRRRSPLVGWMLLSLVVINVVVTGTFLHDKRHGDMLREFVDAGEVLQQFTDNLGMIAGELPHDDFYRVQNAQTVHYNSAMVQEFPGLSFYFSTMSGDLSAFREELDSRPGWSGFAFDGFDERAMPTTLLATRYYLTGDSAEERARVPFGFRLEQRTPRGDVYVNDHPLPLGFVYESVIDRTDYLRLDPVDRQAAMLQGAVVDDGVVPGVPRATPIPQAVEVPFTVVKEEGGTLDLEAGVIERTRDYARFTLAIPPVNGAELYVEMREFDNVARSASNGATFVPQPDQLPTAYTAGRVRKGESWKTPDSPYYWGNRSQLVNLGYQRGEVTTIAIEPRKVGTLSFESLRVLALPMDDYEEAVDGLRATQLTDVELRPNRVTGRVDPPRAGLLFLSIPFSSGWSATIDGEPVETVRTNTGFIGLPVSAGEQVVALEYFTPGLRWGLIVGLLALIMAGGAVAAKRWKRGGARAR